MGLLTHGGITKPSGSVKFQVIHPEPEAPPSDGKISGLKLLSRGLPWFGQPKEIFTWRLKNFYRLVIPALKIQVSQLLKLSHIHSALYLNVIRANGDVVQLGLASLRVVTTAGVGFIVDAFQNLVEVEIQKYHGIGTGTIAENATDTALGTELTTQYNPDSTRATGTTIEGASANIYRTVGTNTVDAAVAITEHGILSQAATGGGVLLDRSVFAVINLASGDSLASTYDLTFPGGS